MLEIRACVLSQAHFANKEIMDFEHQTAELLRLKIPKNLKKRSTCIRVWSGRKGQVVCFLALSQPHSHKNAVPCSPAIKA